MLFVLKKLVKNPYSGYNFVANIVPTKMWYVEMKYMIIIRYKAVLKIDSLIMML